jgi:hypothetical protein
MTMTARKIAAGVALGVGVMVAGATAQAATCPSVPSPGDRVFTLTTSPDSTCLAFGPGNLSGNNDAVNQLGYITLDKSDDTTSGVLEGILTFTPPTSGLSGTFSFTPNPGYTNYVVALKSGEGQADPDWAAFSLVNGVTSGSWSISGRQELSHANLYAQLVPLPGAVLLFGSALAGLAWMRRRQTNDPIAA